MYLARPSIPHHRLWDPMCVHDPQLLLDAHRQRIEFSCVCVDGRHAALVDDHVCVEHEHTQRALAQRVDGSLRQQLRVARRVVLRVCTVADRFTLFIFLPLILVESPSSHPFSYHCPSLNVCSLLPLLLSRT